MEIREEYLSNLYIALIQTGDSFHIVEGDSKESIKEAYSIQGRQNRKVSKLITLYENVNERARGVLNAAA